MQRLIAGQAEAANAAEIYSTSRVSDVANAFADAAAARLFSRVAAWMILPRRRRYWHPSRTRGAADFR